MSLVRQNFHEECEEALNKQINLELFASYVYLSMVSQRIDQTPPAFDVYLCPPSPMFLRLSRDRSVSRINLLGKI
jgi:hypothetical protein